MRFCGGVRGRMYVCVQAREVPQQWGKRPRVRLPVCHQARRGPAAVVVLCLSYLLSAPCYVTLAKDLGIQHEAVNHSRGQFVRRTKHGRKHIQCHTGTIDSVWALWKRFIPKTLSSHSDKLWPYGKAFH